MKKFVTILALLLTAFACTKIDEPFFMNDEKFLTENPLYFYTPDNAFSSQDQVEQALISCYSHFRNMYAMTSEGREMFVFRCYNGTDMYDVTTIRHNYQFNDYSIITPEHSAFNYIFRYWYQMISYANLVLHAADLPGITWDSDENYRYVKAQARFFRAWSYRNLGECFGGVFLVDKISTEPRYDFERATRVDTYKFAIKDLEESLEDFPESSIERGRIVRGAAQHTLAQLYLDLGIALGEEGRAAEAKTAYEKSAEYAEGLITGGRYALMRERFGTRMSEGPTFYYANQSSMKTPDHTYASAGVILEGNVIWDMYQTGNIAYQDGNTEAIWIIHCDLDSYLGLDRGSRLNYSRSFSPSIREALPGICDGLMEDTGGRGVTWVMPTEYVRSMIWEGKWGDGDLRNSDVVFRRTLIGNVPGSAYYGKVIPWNVIYKKGGSTSDQEKCYTQAFPISCKIASDIYPDDAYGGNKSYLFRDDYVIRLAETYLVQAEAYMRAGELGKAAESINAVRSRAKCNYLVTADDVNLDLILDERARELMYEENRWCTLLRMGGTVAVDRIREYSYWDYPRMGTMPNYNLWPIPQKVIDTNKDVKVQQNEGWY